MTKKDQLFTALLRLLASFNFPGKNRTKSEQKPDKTGTILGTFLFSQSR